ncbi:MAG: hypothetical protein ABUL61_07390 [Oleiharenicola lentus]
MPTTLRRLLNHLPLSWGGRGAIYIRSSWHKPTPFDQWTSQPPFRVPSTLRTDHFGRLLRRQRLVRWAVRLGLAFAALWLVIESVRGLVLL